MKTVETPLIPATDTIVLSVLLIGKTNKYRLHTEPEVYSILVLRPQFELLL